MSHSLMIMDEIIRMYKQKDSRIVNAVMKYNHSQSEHGVNPCFILDLMINDISVDVAKTVFNPHKLTPILET